MSGTEASVQSSQGQAASSTLAYDLALLLFRGITKVFFREVRPRGAFNIPRNGPVIFVGAPHSNQVRPVPLISEDAALIRRGLVVPRPSPCIDGIPRGRATPCFLGRCQEYETKGCGIPRREFVKQCAYILLPVFSLIDPLLVPVARSQDSAKAGTGKLYLSQDDPCLVLGEGTKFLEELRPKMQIMLSKAVNSSIAEVVEVISDTRLRIKNEFHNETEKGTKLVREKLEEAKSQGIDGLTFKTLPYVDQNEMYQDVYQRLRDGHCVAIYPEGVLLLQNVVYWELIYNVGGSHDRTDLLPFKAGFAMMALGAMASYPNVNVKIVPVGLSYFHAHRFRSRAVIEFGPPLDVSSELVERFKNGGLDKREAVSKLLNQVYDALKAVTVRAPDYDTLMVRDNLKVVARAN
jgi:glycerol-3-phosphate O-acyltransferase / dihydroxyacetone phosphate acyltransferase